MLEPSNPGTTAPLLESDVLRTFVAIAESGSFTRAAGQIYRSTSAVSMQIKRLEDTLGRPLFVREARQVRLTPAGETLLGYARRLLKLNEEAIAHFLQPALQGRVRFGTPADVGTRILPGLLALFARSHPGVEVDVSVARSIDMIERIDAGELDLALREQTGLSISIADQPMSCVALGTGKALEFEKQLRHVIDYDS